MLKEQFVNTDRIILNYFVPFTSGKFIASCLMFGDSVVKAQSDLTKNLDWQNIEYNDFKFWWQESDCDWFNSEHWFGNLSTQALEAIGNNQYCFYTCHEDYSVNYLKKIFPNAQVLMIVPDYQLCRKNYLAKNWVADEPDFETSRVAQEFLNFKSIATNLVFDQRHIYDQALFCQSINNIATNLNIRLDLDQVLDYRTKYLEHQLNK